MEREALQGIAKSRDWGHAINVGEAAGGGDGYGLPKAFSVGRARTS